MGDNSFECLSLPLTIHSQKRVRSTYLKLSRLVHPDKNSNVKAKEAFQILSAAFETLYDRESQRIHLEELLVSLESEQRKREREKEKDSKKKRREKERTTNKKKKRNTKHCCKQKQQQPAKHWEDVVADLKRREKLEKEFIRKKSDERLTQKVKGLVWKAMKVCRILDERAGCPSTYINGLWAPLYEQEVRESSLPLLPKGWEIRRRCRRHHQQQKYCCENTTTDTTNNNTISDNKNEVVIAITEVIYYRNIPTGEECETHPDPNVEDMIQKARNAEHTNKYRFENEKRLFLNEVVDYLRDDHDYFDMDEDITELTMEECERDNPTTTTTSGGNNQSEYDY